MNWSFEGPQVSFRIERVAQSDDVWAILDDFYPNLLTGFRIAEYNAYLERFPRLAVYSTLPDFERHAREFSRLYPELGSRVRPFSNARGARFAYLNFLNNAATFLPYLERWRTPFVLTLYPGGGFGIDEPESDDKLARVCASPYLRHVIVTQRRTAAYLAQRHPAVPSSFVYGCVLNRLYFPDVIEPRVWFGEGKDTFDICFVAEKYMAHGLNKGYPTFIEACRKVAAEMPETRVHVVGGFTQADWPLSELSSRVGFHGRLATHALREFFRRMDAVASPNVPFTLHAGNFDGFPTAACKEASLCGVAMVVSDVLAMNTSYAAGDEIAIVRPDADAFAEALVSLGRDCRRLRALALAGQARSRELLAPERQIEPRIAILEREAAAAGVAL